MRIHTTSVRSTIERASDADLAFLAMDRGPVPEQLAVVLRFDRGVEAAEGTRLLGERIGAVPRLRQRLVRTPLGCGPPIWVDDDAFTPDRHVTRTLCAKPGDERALLDTVLPHVLRRLPRDRPLWRAVFVDGLAGGHTALVLVVHHVLTDGLGALAVLDRLTDGAGGVAIPPARPRPAARSLAMDAWRCRLRALAMSRQRLRQLRTAMAAGGGISPVRAQPCSLRTITGPRRRVAAVHAPLSALHDATHRHDATVNSALLTAVAEALRQLLERREETISTVTVAVPAGAPRAAGVTAGNAVAPLLVPVPVAGPWDRRLRQVAAEVRRHRAGATGPAPITVLGGAFRLLAALGGYRWYMTHQRRMHTLVSYVRGPASTVRFGGATVLEMTPISVGGESNIPVNFLALSYAGSLVLTAVADPDACPELDLLAQALQADLDAIGTNGTGTCGDGGFE